MEAFLVFSYWLHTSHSATCQSWWRADSWPRHYWPRNQLQATDHKPLAPEPTGPWWCRWYTGSLIGCQWSGQQMPGSGGSSCSLSLGPYWSWMKPILGCCQQQWQEKVIQWGGQLWWPKEEMRRKRKRVVVTYIAMCKTLLKLKWEQCQLSKDIGGILE